jgi:hypothetical protein
MFGKKSQIQTKNATVQNMLLCRFCTVQIGPTKQGPNKEITKQMGGRRCSTSREERLSLSVEKSGKKSRRENMQERRKQGHTGLLSSSLISVPDPRTSIIMGQREYSIVAGPTS